MTEEVIRFIQRAEHALRVAQDLMEDGYPSDAASKIYYSIKIEEGKFFLEAIKSFLYSSGKILQES